MGFLDEADREQERRDQIHDLQTQVNGLLAMIREQQVELDELRNDMEADIDRVRDDVSEVRADMYVEISNLDTGRDR